MFYLLVGFVSGALVAWYLVPTAPVFVDDAVTKVKELFSSKK